jgi:excisionase family DNA binding protein
MDKLLLNVDEAAGVLGIGRTRVFELLTTAEHLSVKIGRRRLVPRSACEDFVTRLCGTAADSSATVA